MKDFTTRTPGTWKLLPWDEIHLPKDPNVSICSVRSYMAIAMIMWYQPDLRLTQLRLWEELKYAWNATFHCNLHPNGLEKWPAAERYWLQSERELSLSLTPFSFCGEREGQTLPLSHPILFLRSIICSCFDHYSTIIYYLIYYHLTVI